MVQLHARVSLCLFPISKIFTLNTNNYSTVHFSIVTGPAQLAHDLCVDFCLRLNLLVESYHW